MRRLLLILLLTLLPLQASWAAVCAYCPDQCVLESASADTPVDDTSVLTGDDDCRCCQLGGVGIVASGQGADPVASYNGLVISNKHFHTSIRPDRPERPKWMRAA
jgi:hypothetical protein